MRGSKAPELLTMTVSKFPPSQEWLMKRATFPILVASMLILMHVFPDGRCSFTTKRAGVTDASLSYVCCLCLASSVDKSSPSIVHGKDKIILHSSSNHLLHKKKSYEILAITCILADKLSTRNQLSRVQPPTLVLIFYHL